jgi:hypothetical protein
LQLLQEEVSVMLFRVKVLLSNYCVCIWWSFVYDMQQVVNDIKTELKRLNLI